MYGIVDCDNAYVSYERYYFTQIIHKDMKRLFILMIVILALGTTARPYGMPITPCWLLLIQIERSEIATTV